MLSIESELEKINQVIQKIQKRLDQIEIKLGAFSQPTPRQSMASTTKKQILPQPSTNSSENTLSGGKVLGSLGVICFLLATSYFIKLAIDTGWLTPARQISVAWLFGCGLIGMGSFLCNKDAKYASYLPGAGIAILYMATYAGHLAYDLFGFVFVSFIIAGISFYSLYLFQSYNNNIYVLCAILGTYLVPLLIGEYRGNFFSACLYFLFWDLTFTCFAVFLKRRYVIAIISYLALSLFFILYGTNLAHGSSDILAYTAAFQFFQFILFLAGVSLYSTYNEIPLTTGEAWTFFPVLLFFYVLEYSLLEKLIPNAAPWLSLCFAGIVYLFYYLTKASVQTERLDSFSIVMSWIVLVCFHALYIEILPKEFCIILGLVLFLSLPFQKRIGITFEKLPIIFVVTYTIIGLEYFRLIFEKQSLGSATWLLNIIFGAIIFRGNIFLKQSKTSVSKEPKYLLLSLAGIQTLFGLKRLAALIAPRNIEAFLTSGFWGLYALALMMIAKKLLDKDIARNGLIIFCLVAFKVLFYDINANSAPVRILTLLLTGVLLYSGGFLLRQINTWQTKKD